MSESPPIIIIAIVLILVAVVLIVLCNRGKLKQFRNKKTFLPLFITGLVLALAGAFFMFNGDILGENTTGVAIVIGIIGIGLIATSNFTLLKR
jgi:membrane protein CcdC involved in cytochrome C biogenesis